jgi:hypothetical protein
MEQRAHRVKDDDFYLRGINKRVAQ